MREYSRNPLDVRSPWVLVAGGFHTNGGMDKANLALATYLASQGTPVHLVAHEFASELFHQPSMTLHRVPRPLGSIFLGEQLLDRVGRAVAGRVLSKYPCARVVVNGGNCYWTDINWVHCVHHAWPCIDGGAPSWFRIKNRLTKRAARHRERQATRTARLLLANSQKTKRDLVERIGVDAEKIQTVYLGSESEWRPATESGRRSARASLGEAGENPLVVFVGALSHDDNKGFDTLWPAWVELCRNSDWDARLIVAGSGNGLDRWKSTVANSAFGERVRFLGFTNNVAELLAAADLLVSPVRYEAYGLNVQEAICRGVPAIVSRSAGIAERYPAACAPLLLEDPESSTELGARLSQWRSRTREWKSRFESFGDELRCYSWADMARQIVSIAQNMSSEAVSASPGDPVALGVHN